MKNLRLIKTLTLCGSLPFFLSAILGYFDYQEIAIKISLIYGAVIIAFMSGILWAVAITNKAKQGDKNLVIFSNLLAILGCFAALFCLNWIGFVIEILCFLWLIWVEFGLQKFSQKNQQIECEIFPEEYFKMRLQITALVVSILAINAFLLG